MNVEYYVYADYENNPSKDEDNRLGVDAFESPAAAWQWVESTDIPYRYIEVVDHAGNKYPKEAYVPSGKVNFLLFAGDNYYPRGGYTDLIAKAFSEDELREIVKENENNPLYGSDRFDWWQIVNANTHTIVDEG
ncbi:hypothetical protein BOW89_gp142 [Escherichia phage WG01]|uniref:Phage protein n=1 Tax=Escherichia phage WG01 TaxID=1837931 RepID=A0A172Q1F7_9CAUD|nr:hypothetical protein BOW89_gp142 [Escherichia phage WG01]AND75814.1 hypothetical protein WG01_142 [Escherichia phage WG01]